MTTTGYLVLILVLLLGCAGVWLTIKGYVFPGVIVSMNAGGVILACSMMNPGLFYVIDRFESLDGNGNLVQLTRLNGFKWELQHKNSVSKIPVVQFDNGNNVTYRFKLPDTGFTFSISPNSLGDVWICMECTGQTPVMTNLGKLSPLWNSGN